MIDEAIAELAPVVGVKAACAAVGEPRARHYRRHPKSSPPPTPERMPAPQPRALSEVERKELRAVLNSEDHVDEAPAAAHKRLAAAALAPVAESETACCYAVQDKVWVDGPSGEPWEIYAVLAHTDAPAGQLRSVAPGRSACCAAPTPA